MVRGQADVASAFTLLEVLIAIGIFCIVSFAVLELVVTSLGAARALQVRHADVGMLAAEFAATNTILEEGIESGDFGDFYPGARWERATAEVGTNSLFQVDFTVAEKVGKHEVISTMSILLHRPGSPKGKAFGGTGSRLGVHPIPGTQ
ncbi:MAG: prepilin-type N-terminal cleavage/methylation domain-containing protein [Verrucomicrobia bacterium]|nr:prepilin-type N-terminal cleavage/methylation domain-containing protein [Verrucomicrobiota bacterium]